MKCILSKILNCGVMLVSFAVILSCGKDSEEVSNIDILISGTGEELRIRNDTLIVLPVKQMAVIRDTVVGGDCVEKLNRYIDTKKGKIWYKAKLGEWCLDYNLSPDSTYLIRKDYYFQLIPENSGHVAIPFVPQGADGNMGLYEKFDGTLYIGYDGGVGITPKFGSFGNCWTIIYHIGYSMGGKSVGLDFPTSPETLTWYYSWYKI